MTPMVDFSVALLNALADFLGTEPGIYLFSVVLMCGLAKVIKTFTN